MKSASLYRSSRGSHLNNRDRLSQLLAHSLSVEEGRGVPDVVLLFEIQGAVLVCSHDSVRTEERSEHAHTPRAGWFG
jgi:hypothetical protein